MDNTNTALENEAIESEITGTEVTADVANDATTADSAVIDGEESLTVENGADLTEGTTVDIMDQLVPYTRETNGTAMTVIGIALLVSAIFLVISVLMQNSKSHKLSGTIAGGAETFFGKSKGADVNKKLNVATAIVAAVFMILVIVMYVIQPEVEYITLREGIEKGLYSIDTEATDTEATDAEATGAEATDAEATDAEATDAEATDAEATDAEATDAEATDAEATDAEATDAEATDTEAVAE